MKGRARTATVSGCGATIAISRPARSGRIASTIITATVRRVIAHRPTVPVAIARMVTVPAVIARRATVPAVIDPTVIARMVIARMVTVRMLIVRTAIARRDSKPVRNGAGVASGRAAAPPDPLS